MAGAVATHGRCPVVVIRGGAEDLEGKPVVVGVDGSPASEAAIAFAYDEASRLGVPLIALHTWTDTITAAAFAMAPYAVDWFEVQNEELRLLAERLAGWQEKYPDVQVQRVLTRDHPARSLIDQAREAQLVVVGSRGRGQVAGLLLGSTSQALLHHAPCPLVIVRPD
jgi:nucleotide-binding universal stress UspA family protein